MRKYLLTLAGLLVLWILGIGLYLSGWLTHAMRSAEPNYFRIVVPAGFEGPVFLCSDDSMPLAQPQSIKRSHTRDDSLIDAYVYKAEESGLTRIAESDFTRFERWHGIDIYDSDGHHLESSGGPRSSYFDEYRDGIWFFVGDQESAEVFFNGKESTQLQREWRRKNLRSHD